jgi:hypothetical protein
MFERNYYYLVAGLPDIIIDQKKLSFSLEDFKQEMKDNLHPEDYRLVEILFLPVDNRNLLYLLQKSGQSVEDSGKYSIDDLEQEIKDPAFIPEYMQKFIAAYKSETSVFDGLSWGDQLTWLFYGHAKSCKNEFLSNWFAFDLNLKNIVAGFNIRKHGLKGEKYLIGDNEIVQAVKKSSLRDFGLGNEFEYMEKLISIQENSNLLEREIAMDMLRWEFIDDQNTFNYFTVEVLLGYIIKLQIVDRWMKLEPETGKEMFRKLLNDLEMSYEFPREFMINDARKNRQENR